MKRKSVIKEKKMEQENDRAAMPECGGGREIKMQLVFMAGVTI